jgi:DNA-binding SARP family transcriptional activator/predicted ATPase
MLQVLVLGPSEVAVDGERRSLGGAIPRALVVMLALADGRAVSDDVLLEAAWAGTPPASGRHALSVYVSTLRKTIAPAATITRSGQGFSLEPAEGSTVVVDANEFATLGEDARRSLARMDIGAARESIDRALALWRGRPFADLPESDEWSVEAARLDSLHRELLQSRAECRVADGDLSGIAELETFAAQDAFDEATQMRLMRALYLAGRQQDALDVFRSYARRVRDELGLEPSAAMVALERAVLNQRLGLTGSGGERPRRSLPMFGREPLVAEISELLRERTNVVSLIGMGGIGKTTTAVAVADVLADDGRLVTWIAAEELTSGDVPSQIALDITGLRNIDPFDIRFERDTPRLLVVDGFENHEQEAPYIDFLVGALPSLRVLLTSRRPTRVAAEWIVQVPPLEIPADDAATVTDLRSSPAGAFFADLIDRRARGALDDEGAAATAAAIIRRLAGIPLALELAAARVGVLSVDELAETLDIASLAGGTTSAPTHRSMSRVLDSTVALLSPNARRALEAAGVFRSAFATVDIAAVADLPESRVETSLRELYDAGLILRGREWKGPTRFTVLDPIREYAAEALRIAGVEQQIRSRHVDRIVARTAELLNEFADTETQHQAVVRFDSLRGDFAAALDYAIEQNRVSDAVDLVCDAQIFWRRLSPREGLAWLERVSLLEIEPAELVRVQRAMRSLLHLRGRWDEALTVSEAILASGAATLHDRQKHAGIRAEIGDAKEAIGLLEGICAEAREANEPQLLLQTLCFLAQAYVVEGDLETALERAYDVDDVIATYGAQPIELAYARAFQSAPMVAAGEDRAAAERLRVAVENAVRLQDANAAPSALLLIADLAITRGDLERGRAIAATATRVMERAGVVLSQAHLSTVPGARVATVGAEADVLTLAEAVEQAEAVLDEILAE